MCLIYIFFISGIIMSCNDVSSPSNVRSGSNSKEGWLIPASQIADGGPGKDSIPALEKPDFIPVSQASYLNNDSRVLVLKSGLTVKIYPHSILNWHEIVNDEIGQENVSITYCPLTGSGIGYESLVRQGGKFAKSTFGVSGLLYNNNLILYDRLTDSYWSQMRMQCVGGELKGDYPNFIHLLETGFGAVKDLYPDAQVLSNITNVYNPSQYKRYPYGDYRTNHDNIIFLLNPDDRRLNRKERVLGVLEYYTKRVYQFKHFASGTAVINDEIDGSPIVIAGSSDHDFIAAFERPDSSAVLQKTSEALPAVMEDSDGNVYNFFGEAVKGPLKGTKLKALKSFTAYWFSFGAFYPGIEIYGE